LIRLPWSLGELPALLANSMAKTKLHKIAPDIALHQSRFHTGVFWNFLPEGCKLWFPSASAMESINREECIGD